MINQIKPTPHLELHENWSKNYTINLRKFKNSRNYHFQILCTQLYCLVATLNEFCTNERSDTLQINFLEKNYVYQKNFCQQFKTYVSLPVVIL